MSDFTGILAGNHVIQLFIEDVNLLTQDMRLSQFTLIHEYDNTIPSGLLVISTKNLSFLQYAKVSFIPAKLCVITQYNLTDQEDAKCKTLTLNVLIPSINISSSLEEIQYSISFISDYGKYMSQGKIRCLQGTSVGVLSKLLEDHIVTDAVNGNQVTYEKSLKTISYFPVDIEDKEVAEPIKQQEKRSDIDESGQSDQQNWIQYNIPDKDFVSHVIDHSFVKDDFYITGLGLSQDLSIVQYNKYTQKMKSTSNKSMICFYEDSITNPSDYLFVYKGNVSFVTGNLFFNYLTSNRKTNSIDFIDNTSPVQQKNINMGVNTLLGRSAIAGSFINNGNCHKNYNDSFISSTKHKTNIESLRTKVETTTINFIGSVPLFLPYVVVPKDYSRPLTSTSDIPIDKNAIMKCIVLKVIYNLKSDGILTTTIEGSII